MRKSAFEDCMSVVPGMVIHGLSPILYMPLYVVASFTVTFPGAVYTL